jgi:hypothetical protein
MTDECPWPELPWREWEPTISTLHMWTQIVGKIRLMLAPPINHWWHIALPVTARGLTTSAIPYDGGDFQIDLDFVDHRLVVRDGRPNAFVMDLRPRSVAAFYGELMAGLQDRGIDVRIFARPVEVEEAIPFAEDEVHASYEPHHAELFWRGLANADRVLQEFRTRFIGKASPVGFYWGSFDLSSTRFSGRTAPRHGGGIPNCPDWVMVEAYSHELTNSGWWPLSEPPGPSFFAYAYPEPDGYRKAPIRPGDAYFDSRWGEYLLPYDAVRDLPDPDAAVLEFLQSTYAAAADLGGWDREALEAISQPHRPPRKAWSVAAP